MRSGWDILPPRPSGIDQLLQVEGEALQRVRAIILEREKHTDWVQQLQEAR